MSEDQIIFTSIGKIHSPFQKAEGVPIQPRGAAGVTGTVVLDPMYEEGLRDLEGFSHLMLVYEFHQAGKGQLLVKPFLDDVVHGVFATRAPQRPNQIGISVVKLVGRTDNILTVENLDILDGTPLLDIKPYVPEFDYQEDVRVGWLEGKLDQIDGQVADDRFAT